MKDVAVILMAYNEAGTVADVLREIDAVLRPSRWSYEVVVVDDGSTDGTGEIVEQLGRELPNIRVHHHSSNRGIGEVYRTGFGSARSEYLTFLPADGQFPATIVTQFLPLMEGSDLVLGYLPLAKRTPVAKVLSIAERTLYRLLFGMVPRFQGIMMFRRALLGELNIRPAGRGWGVLMEIIVKSVRSNRRIIAEPTALRGRMSGASKVNNLRSVWANVRQALELRRSL